MELFVAILIAAASTWAIKRGSEKLADNVRRWWGGVREAVTGGGNANTGAGRAVYGAARAGTRGAVTIGYGVGAGVAAGWREGWTRAADWRDARREASAARQVWAALPRHHRVDPDLHDACDPWWQRGRLHGRRGEADGRCAKLPPVYQRGVEQGRRDRHADAMSDEQLYRLGYADGLRNTQPQLAAPAYRRGWADGQEAIDSPDETDQTVDVPPRGEPAAAPEPDVGEAMPTPSPAPPETPAPAYEIGVSPEVGDLDGAMAFAHALKDEAGQEVENAQAGVGVARSEHEAAEAALGRARVKLKALEVYEASLVALGFGQRLRSHVHQMVEGARQRSSAAGQQLEAAQHHLAAARRALAGAEQEQAQANALIRGLLTHRNVELVAAGAVGGLANRQVYGGAPGRAGAR